MNETTTDETQIEIIAPSALESQERAQIDVQIATAHRFPRPNLSVIVAKMKSFATLDEATAEGCFYVLNRQGKEIRGPSARLAEIACACYGNIRAASRVIGNDGKVITSQAVCHDLENNVSISIETKRRITDKNGKTYSDDMQVTTGNAACSIALRNAVFKVIPLALIHPVYDAARQCAIGDVKTLSARREKAVETFGKMGVTKDRVLAVVGKAATDDIDLPALETLLGLHTAIRDGDTTIDEAFPAIVAAKPIFAKSEKTAGDHKTPPINPYLSASEVFLAVCSAVDKIAPSDEKKYASQVVDDKQSTDSAETADANLTKLESLMAAETPPITGEELGRVLKSFNKSVPARFKGPEQLRDDVLADAIKEWPEYRSIILAERRGSAS